MATDWAGLVPQVTAGRSAAASTTISWSNSAPSSVTRLRQSSSARSQAAPFGLCWRPSRNPNVVSSGAIIPARAPPSMDMLQTVIRPAIGSARMAAPRYSMTEPAPPPVPSARMMPSTRSLAVQPAGRSPSTVTAMAEGLTWRSVWVASTCSTSVVPMPKASAPNAP